VKRALLVAGCALAVAGAAAAVRGEAAAQAPGQVREVSMPGRVFAPGRIQVLVGDTVVWRNADATNHTVTSDDDRFDSGYIGPGLTFAQVFTRTGRYLYHCSIHRFMRGEVVVVPVALTAPREAIVSGGRVVLQGFAPTGTAKVTVARAGKGGRVLARVAPAGDGSFTVQLRAFLPENVVALAKGLASPAVHVAVAPKVRARRSGRLVRASASPARPGARAVLQSYVRERFAWRTIARGRLDRASRTSFRLPSGAGRFRVLVRGTKGWADGASTAIVVHRR
jgi:plastocyanin